MQSIIVLAAALVLSGCAAIEADRQRHANMTPEERAAAREESRRWLESISEPLRRQAEAPPARRGRECRMECYDTGGRLRCDERCD
jgi:hypothetical protein